MSRTTGQPFAQSYVELHKVRQVEFGLLSSGEVERMSAVKIEKERIYDDKGIPQLGAINDPRMGTMDKDLRCFTCKGTHSECPGHFGHIELAKPVYHAGLIEYIRKVLRCVCFNCSRLLLDKSDDNNQLSEIKRTKNYMSRFNKVLRVCDPINLCDLQKGGCGYRKPKFTKNGLRIMVEYMEENQAKTGSDSKQVLQAEEAQKVLEKISVEDCQLLGFRPEISRPENMIIKNLPVAPPPVRPSVAMSSTNRSEDDLTYAYQQILKQNIQLQSHINKGANQSTINEIIATLQYYVATLMDNEIQGQATQKHKSGKPLKAIRARLRGKEGRLRGNLMGKRVDFSSRSVITPDPILQLDQLGVPMQIAMNLTVPETVTSENIDKMRALVQNGPNKWPGAKYILRHDDRQIDLSSLRNLSDAHLEPGYKVERHLKNNDYVIFNRQPSLHKMSLMGHRVKVLPFSTFRLNLSVTTPYNADFDGDEMNMHVPQSFETMAEVKEIMAVPNQIVSPKDNKPVMGIVQDSLLGVMIFTLRDTFIEKELVMNLLMWVNYDDQRFPTPCIIKPKPLWSGKQIFSLILPKINLLRYQPLKRKGEDSARDDEWSCYGDKNLLIQDGELLCGNLNKSNIGSSSGGIIHVTWKEKGPYATKDFMSNTQLMINNWLHQNGFTVGVQDIIASKYTLNRIKTSLQDGLVQIDKITSEAQTGKLQQQPGKDMIQSFEFKVNEILNKARDIAGKSALEDLATYNRLKAMVTAGSKGSDLNISQIMACVGQQNVEGKRIPFGFYQRTLPHFSKDDFGPESKGFVENCYLSGLTPQEFFFHAMGGREGLIDTAVKTAETGYIQRRLIKALEDVMVQYDGTVRTSKHQVIQFLYGEDGMAGEHIEDLKIDIMGYDNAKLEKNCNFLPDHFGTLEKESILSQCLPTNVAREIVSDLSLQQQLADEFKQLKEDREALRTVILKGSDDYLSHLAVNVPRIIWNAKTQFKIKPFSKTDLHPSYVLEKLTNLTQELTAIPGLNVRKDPLILAAKENSTWLFKIYLRTLLCTKNMIQFERMTQQSFDWVIGEIKTRFESAISNPGEMIGPIAAQSIGEPATQMTLNTFHFAGVSAKNVTLGVPRLKEIINVAKNIKTPTMKIYLAEEHKKDEQVAIRFGSKIEYTTLQQVVESSGLYYDPDFENTIVSDDQALVASYLDVPVFDQMGGNMQRIPSKWLMRFVLNNEKVNVKHLSMQMIEDKLTENFQDQFQIMKSDDNAESLIIRMRMLDLGEDDDEDEEQTVCMFLKEQMDKLLNEMALKGFPEVTKVTFTKTTDIEYDKATGQEKKTKDNWMIETDGVALQKVLGCADEINFQRTTSNDIQEILRVLGIEAVRLSLINELRFVLSSYGIYVNYRHLSTLCDVMTQRGILTSITRHGINRVDTGPLRKCSFEETVEILYEAAVFAECDNLSGITENIIMGQLAPYGTGCFDLVIDKNVLNEFAQTKDGDLDYSEMQQPTPIVDNNDYYINNQEGTPHNIPTPLVGNYMNTQYTPGATPGYEGQMSPGAFGGQSAYMSPNYMGTPQGLSPVYVPYQSPIYQPIGGGPTSGAGMRSPAHNASPSYSPTQTRMSPAYNANVMTPAYNSSNFVGSQSPAYYSGNNLNQSIGSSGASYSPTMTQNPTPSPKYSPTTPNYNRPMTSQQFSPQYSPTAHVPVSTPRYQASPKYTVGSASPKYDMSNNHTPASASPGPNNVYVPSQSPRYNPSSSPAFSTPGQTRANPTYVGGAAIGGVSPIDDSSSDVEMTPAEKKK